ncbi:MAG: VanZ family protein, partial [Candidatus Symbiothrix sp.]|nr:VanZ family protein [Candidatus Symbiothrix sp.]
KKISFIRIFLGSFLFPLIFSGLIEIGQESLTLTRSGDWMDFLFDGIGTSVGLLACWLYNRKI